jgi:hypothetical protein
MRRRTTENFPKLLSSSFTASRSKKKVKNHRGRGPGEEGRWEMAVVIVEAKTAAQRATCESERCHDAGPKSY